MSHFQLSLLLIISFFFSYSIQSFQFSPLILIDKWTSNGEWSFLELSEILFTARIEGTLVEGTYWVDTSEYPFVLTLQTSYPFFIYMECLYRIEVDSEGLKTLYLQIPSDPLAILTGTAEKPNKFDEYQLVMNGSRTEPFLNVHQRPKMIFGEWANEKNFLDFSPNAEFNCFLFDHSLRGSFHGTINQTGFFTLHPVAPTESQLFASYQIRVDSQGRELLQVSFFQESINNLLFKTLFEGQDTTISFWRRKPITTSFEVDRQLDGKWFNEDEWINFFQTGFWIGNVSGIIQQGSFFTASPEKIFLRTFNSTLLTLKYKIDSDQSGEKRLALSLPSPLSNSLFNSTIRDFIQPVISKNTLDPIMIDYWMSQSEYLNIFPDGSFELTIEGVLFQGICEMFTNREPKQIIFNTQIPHQQQIRGIFELSLDSDGFKWVSLQLPSLANILSGETDKPTTFSQKTVVVMWEWDRPQVEPLSIDPLLISRWMNLEMSFDFIPSSQFTLSYQGRVDQGTYLIKFTDPKILTLKTPTSMIEFYYEIEDSDGRLFLILKVLQEGQSFLNHSSILLWEKTPAAQGFETTTIDTSPVEDSKDTNPFLLDSLIASLAERENQIQNQMNNEEIELNQQPATKYQVMAENRAIAQRCTTCSINCQRTCQFSKPSKRKCAKRCEALMCDSC